MNTKLVLQLLITLVFLSSCMHTGKRVKGNGNIKSETRQVTQSDRIKLSGGVDVFLEQGETSVRVETDENIIPYILTRNIDGWLEIKTENNTSLKTSDRIKVHITTPDIRNVRVEGSGTVVCNEKFASNNDISFEILGSGNIKAKINAPKIDAEIAGSGNVKVEGETRDVFGSIAGSGNYEGAELKAEDAEVKIAGSGDAKVFADHNLKASITGSGDIRYRGNADVDKHIAGSGSVVRME